MSEISLIGVQSWLSWWFCHDRNRRRLTGATREVWVMMTLPCLPLILGDMGGVIGQDFV